MNTNVFTSMVIRKRPNWIVDAALNEHGITTSPNLAFSTVGPALSAVRKGIKPPPDFVFIDEAEARRALKSVAHLTYALIELRSKVIIISHDEGRIDQLNRILLNHGSEPVLDTNLGAYIGKRIESL